jgi:hypothetical protein
MIQAIPANSRHNRGGQNSVANDKIADAMHFLAARNFQTAFAPIVAS